LADGPELRRAERRARLPARLVDPRVLEHEATNTSADCAAASGFVGRFEATARALALPRVESTRFHAVTRGDIPIQPAFLVAFTTLNFRFHFPFVAIETATLAVRNVGILTAHQRRKSTSWTARHEVYRVITNCLLHLVCMNPYA
jgi:hypothetical protein